MSDGGGKETLETGEAGAAGGGDGKSMQTNIDESNVRSKNNEHNNIQRDEERGNLHRGERDSGHGKHRGGRGGRGSGAPRGKGKKWEKLDTAKLNPWGRGKEAASPPQPLVFDKTPSSSTHVLNPEAPVFVPKKPAATSPQPVQHNTPPGEGSGEIRRRGAKHKQSDGARFEERADHLLNFTYARREEAPIRRYQKGPVVHFTKERFLQANYRFVVNAAHTYLRNLYEADLIVDWDNIEQVCMFTHAPYQCPICWDPPKAAKITKCGHIYCWACILRYLGMTTRGYRKCPICIESVSATTLKSAVIEYRKEIKEGDVVPFVLMKRAKACMVALPDLRWRDLDNLLMHSDEDARFSRFVRMPDITPVIEQEQIELAEARASAIASGEVDALPAIDLAQHHLDERRVASCPMYPKKEDTRAKIDDPSEKDVLVEDVWHEGGTKVASPSATAAVPPPEAVASALTPPEEPKKPESSPSEKEATGSQQYQQTRSQGKGKDQNGMTEETHYYFYQAADGQHVFLQPLAFRCLLKEYGGLNKLPHQVDGKIEFMEEISVSEASRKRWKKIVGHIPLGTAFSFCDIDINTLVSEETRKAFAQELNWRKGKWEKKKKERGEGSVQRRQQQQQQPQQSSDSSLAWDADYSSLPEEVRLALSEEEQQQLMTGQLKREREKEEKERGKKEKEEPGSNKEKQPPQAQPQQQQRRRQQRKIPKGSASLQKSEEGAMSVEASTSPSIPSFLQVLKNSAPVPIPPSQKNGNEGDTKAGGKGKKHKAQQALFSNNSTRRY